MIGLEHLRRWVGGNPQITPEVAQPFLDMERDRQSQMQARMFAGPMGAFAVHAAPVIPHEGHMQSISQAVPQMLGMHAAPAADAAHSSLGTIFDHLAPTLAMGSLGAGGAIAASYLASKLWKKMFGPKLPVKTAADPIIECRTTKESAMQNVRLVKFAALGAHEGKVPTNLVGAVKMAAFSLGYLQEVLADRKDKLAEEEVEALKDLNSAIKTASAISQYLNNQTAEICKIATVEVKHIEAAASENAADLNTLLTSSRTKVAKENEMTGISEVIAIPQGIMSKMAKSLDMLAVSPETAVYIEQGNPIGLTCGILGLMGR